MSHLTREQQSVVQARELSKLANERFGLYFALKLTLESLDATPIHIDAMLQAAQTRDIEAFKQQLEAIWISRRLM